MRTQGGGKSVAGARKGATMPLAGLLGGMTKRIYKRELLLQSWRLEGAATRQRRGPVPDVMLGTVVEAASTWASSAPTGVSSALRAEAPTFAPSMAQSSEDAMWALEIYSPYQEGCDLQDCDDFQAARFLEAYGCNYDALGYGIPGWPLNAEGMQTLEPDVIQDQHCGKDGVETDLESTAAPTVSSQAQSPLQQPADSGKDYSVEVQVRAQVDYYFSMQNLSVDAYLRSLMDMDGWVSLKAIVQFPRMRKICPNVEAAAVALASSQLVEVAESPLRVRVRDIEVRALFPSLASEEANVWLQSMAMCDGDTERSAEAKVMDSRRNGRRRANKGGIKSTTSQGASVEASSGKQFRRQRGGAATAATVAAATAGARADHVPVSSPLATAGMITPPAVALAH